MTRKYISQSEKDAMLKASLAIIAEEDGQVTLRHLFYRLVGQGLIDKTEAGYKRVGSYTKEWRYAGSMPYTALSDNTRWYYGDIRYTSPEAAVASALKNYHSDIWGNWNAHKEIWTEKDAMVAILLSVANPLGVKVFSTRGYASIGSMANTAAPTILGYLNQEKNVYIYYFGDHDPSGKDIDRAAKSAIERHLKDSEKVNFHFERVAILPEDIEKYNLPTRPTKKTDSRSANFEGESVELDSMDMRIIKQRVLDCIMENVPGELMEEALANERADKERITNFIRGLQSGGHLALSSGEDSV
jgi:hypothetical protein